MALFEEHITQAKSNLQFFEGVNQTIKNYYDWQVTICFYTAVHLVNAHLSKHSLQYRQHKDVNYALNPEVATSVSKLPEDEYDSYIALQRLSRRSRYLVNEKDNNLQSANGFLTYDTHLAKAIRHLDKLLFYFNKKYSLNLSSTNVTCVVLTKAEKLSHFLVK